mmetsp:Transcript_52824/g.127957  ORF Transcript_52824/g.127957 Transcript_52824/m.127957 type:complete len:303 (-) Transcript_52824:839-1747(-)
MPVAEAVERLVPAHIANAFDVVPVVCVPHLELLPRRRHHTGRHTLVGPHALPQSARRRHLCGLHHQLVSAGDVLSKVPHQGPGLPVPAPPALAKRPRLREHLLLPPRALGVGVEVGLHGLGRQADVSLPLVGVRGDDLVAAHPLLSANARQLAGHLLVQPLRASCCRHDVLQVQLLRLSRAKVAVGGPADAVDGRQLPRGFLHIHILPERLVLTKTRSVLATHNSAIVPPAVHRDPVVAVLVGSHTGTAHLPLDRHLDPWALSQEGHVVAEHLSGHLPEHVPLDAVPGNVHVAMVRTPHVRW